MAVKIKKGDRVAITYEGRLEDGTIFDQSKHGIHDIPLEFVVGSGEVIEGFDKEVINMEKGQEKEFSINPKEAYGDHNPDLKNDVPRSMLSEDAKIEEGMEINMQTKDGKEMPVKIIKFNDQTLTLDLNHPLAGKKLIFKIKVVNVNGLR